MTAFPLADPRLDALRPLLLSALRAARSEAADDYARAIQIEAEKAGLMSGHERSAIVDAALDFIATSDALDAAADRAPAANVPRAVDLRKLAMSEPDRPAFIVQDWLPQGEVTLFAGHGGTGKSMLALTLAVCIAVGRPFFGLPTQARRVAFLSLEDSEPVLHWRLARICEWLGIGVADLADRLLIWDGTDSDAALMTETRDGAMLTAVYSWVVERIAADQVSVLVLDGASDAYDANENARAPVRKFIRSLRQLIPADGAVVLLAHVDKGAARSGDTSQGYSGSTAWSNSVRARWYLRREREDDDELLLEVQKSNLAAAGHSMRLRWNAEASVFVADDVPTMSKLDRELAAVDEREAVLQLIREADAGGDPIPASTGGPRTCWHVLSAQTGFPDSLKRAKDGRRRLLALIETLRAAKAIRVDTITTTSRNTKEVLRAA